MLSFLKTLRARWPGQKLYVIADNYSPHKHPHVRAWAAGNDVELVFLPTYGSWLNWIESEFAALRYYAPRGKTGRTNLHRASNLSGRPDHSLSSGQKQRLKESTYMPLVPQRQWLGAAPALAESAAALVMVTGRFARSSAGDEQ